MRKEDTPFSPGDEVAYFTSCHSWPICARVLDVICQDNQEPQLRIGFTSQGKYTECYVAWKTCQHIVNCKDFYATIKKMR